MNTLDDDEAGSDEVGTATILDPSVCAVLVRKEDIPFLKELQVNDSKQLNDEKYVKKPLAHEKTADPLLADLRQCQI